MDIEHHRFDAFDARARRALQRAREESEREGLAYIGTEQLLLGLLSQSGGVARRVLRNFGVELDSARTSLQLLRVTSPEHVPNVGAPGLSGDMGLTPLAKRLLELAVEQGRGLGSGQVGPEHLLLGLIALNEGAAVDMLHHRGVDLAAMRSRTLQLTRGGAPRSARRQNLETGLLDLRAAEHALELPNLRVQLKNNVVMCRIDDLDMDAIDTLIEAGVRANRSDAAGWLIKAGLESKRAVLDSVKDKVLEIRRIRAAARALAENAEADG